MTDFPPLMRDQRPIDDDQLRLVAALHFALAALTLLGIVGLVVHYFIAREYLNTPDLWKFVPEAPPAHVLLVMMELSYAFAAFVLVCAAILNIASGVCIQQRKYRMFSLAIAGLDTLLIPIGTLLGCFTFVVLLRDSVRETYQE